MHTDVRYRIRRADPADLPQVAEIERAVFSDPWPAAAFRDLLGPLAYVALSPTASVAGYIFARRAANEAEILNLAVHPGHGRRGLGSGLLRTVLGDLERAGAIRVFLEVRESNAPARAFYQGRGFRPVGRRAGYYTRPREDALILVHEISGVKGPA